MTTPDPALEASDIAARAQLVASVFNRQVMVNLDPWGVNPLADDLRQENPTIFGIASREAPVPTLFESGDLPPFLASGVDPQVLMRLPYTLRHTAAAEPDAGRLLQMIEDYGNDPMAMLPHPGLELYKQRISRWASGFDRPPTPPTAEQMDAEYAALFPDEVSGPKTAGVTPAAGYKRGFSRGDSGSAA